MREAGNRYQKSKQQTTYFCFGERRASSRLVVLKFMAFCFSESDPAALHALAEAKIVCFCFDFDTDYLLLASETLPAAIAALERADTPFAGAKPMSGKPSQHNASRSCGVLRSRSCWRLYCRAAIRADGLTRAARL